MNLISREELRAKLDRGDTFKLVLTLSEWAFRAKHIPGSLNINSRNKALATLDPDDEIVLHCASELCPARITAYQVLEAQRFQKISRYAGGLLDWEEVGYPLEGEMRA